MACTKMTCAEKFPTLSLVVPLYNKFLDHIALWKTNAMTQPNEPLRAAVIAADSKITTYYNPAIEEKYVPN